MNTRELVRLQIAQKSYFKASGDKKQHHFYVEYHQFLKVNNITVAEIFVPGVFADQPRVPVVVLVPPIPAGEKRPVIIHSHGGPHSRCYLDKPLADNMYLLDQGYIVAWPNYRGSIDHPKDDPDYPVYQKHETTCPNLINLAAEDVYAAAVHLASLPHVDAKNLMLRGGSYGTRINAHILAGIKQSKFKNIFNGVHFAAGMGYLFAEALTMDMPVMISHAVNDPDAPFAEAEYFMQKMCEQRLRYEADEHATQHLQLFVAQHGGHHMLSRELEDGMEDTALYEEAHRYAYLYTLFINTVCGRVKPPAPSLVAQYRQLMEKHWGDLSKEMHAVLRQIEANQEREEHRPLLTVQRKRQQISNAVTTWSRVMGEMQLDLRRRRINPVDEVVTEPLAVAPSEMHLRTLLGDRYREDDLAHNVGLGIKACETVYDYDISDAERLFLIGEYSQFIVDERTLSVNHLVQYHACNAAIGLCYDLYQRIYQLLQLNSRWQALRPDHEFFRLCPDITAFIARFNLPEADPKVDLATMTLFDDSDVPNNQPGINDCLLATNVFLFGNCYDRKSSSVDYQLRNRTERKVELASLLNSLLAPFNIPVGVLTDLIQQHEAMGRLKRGSIYQVAMPKEHSQKLAYASALYGYLKPLAGSLDVTKIVADLLGMREHSEEIKKYILSLQSRCLVPPAVNLTSRCVRMPGSDQQNSLQYQRFVMQCAERIVSCMLNNFESFHSLNAKAPLVRMFKWVLRDNRLPFESTQSPEQQLIRALKSRDWETVTTILKISPGLLTARVVLPAAYIFKNEASKGQSVATTALEVLSNASEFHFSGFYEFLPEEVADGHICTILKNARQVCLYEEVERIPPDKLARFIPHFPKPPERSGIGGFKHVMCVLPPEYRKVCLMTHENIIRDGYDLRDLIEYFTPDEQLELMDYFMRRLTSCKDLYTLVSDKPEDRKLFIFNRYFRKMTDPEFLSSLLERCVPDGDHAALVKECSFNITKGTDVLMLFRYQPQENRIAFVKQHLHLIDRYSVMDLMRILDRADVFDLALEILIKNNIPDNYCSSVLHFMDESLRCEFLKRVNYQLTDTAKLSDFLFWMPLTKEEKIHIMHEHEHLLQDGKLDDKLAEVIEKNCGAEELDWARRVSDGSDILRQKAALK